MKRSVYAILGMLYLTAGAHAQPAAMETQAAFAARCRGEVVAQEPRAAPQAASICQSRWEMATATGPLANAVLALAPASAGAALTPAVVRAALPNVRWAARAQQGELASGALGPIHVGVKPAGASFSWFANGEPIPYDLEEALRIRRVPFTLIGCVSYGASEGTRAYRVNAPGKAPYAVTIAFRNAAVASQSSDYSVQVASRLPTRADLTREGLEPTCPS